MSGPADAVRLRAGNRCEYCRLPQKAFRRGFHIEHIVARQHGGSTGLDNLAFACWTCNLKKGPNLSGVDPATGLVTALFHPRENQWLEHFSAHVATLIPLGDSHIQVLACQKSNVNDRTLRAFDGAEGGFARQDPVCGTFGTGLTIR